MTGLRFRCLVAAVGGVLIFLAAMSRASAQHVPQPCVDLAARENVPLPTTEAEAKAAKVKVFRLFLRGDPLARMCWRAIQMEIDMTRRLER